MITFKRIIKFLELLPQAAVHIKAIWELVCEVINEENQKRIEEAAKIKIGD